MIAEVVPEERRPGALAVYSGVGQAFATVGPLVGGLCAQLLHPDGVASGLPVALGFVLSTALMAAAGWTAARGLARRGPEPTD